VSWPVLDGSHQHTKWESGDQQEVSRMYCDCTRAQPQCIGPEQLKIATYLPEAYTLASELNITDSFCAPGA
jgi:hypothetical protein